MSPKLAKTGFSRSELPQSREMRHDLALCGDPIDHSLSPAMQRAALRSTGLEGTYSLRPGGPEAFYAAVDELRSGKLTGINVTMPHKGRAFEACDRFTDMATLSGSVNTLKTVDGAVHGHSTDADAFADLLQGGALGTPSILILGSGGSAGAALAASTALTEERQVLIQSRRTESAEDLVARLSIDATVVPWATPVDGAVLINATPLGMAGERLPAGLVEVASSLIDLPYAVGETPAVRDARAQQIPTIDGLRFLALQGAASFLWWTGTGVDPEVMEAEARND